MAAFVPRRGECTVTIFGIEVRQTAAVKRRSFPARRGLSAASRPVILLPWHSRGRKRPVSRRRVSKPAEVPGDGLLQVEYGYTGDFNARDLVSAHAATISVNYSATQSLLVEFAHDNVAAQTPRGAPQAVGIGNAYLGLQYTVASEDMSMRLHC